MAKWNIIGYADPEDGIKKEEKEIIALSKSEAKRIAYMTFPEHHEIGVYEIKEDKEWNI